MRASLANPASYGWWRLHLRHPSRMVVLAFASAIAIGTLLLFLPVARAGEGSATLVEAWFTATSAVCVTGLVIVDTGGYWSGFGEAVILGLIQVGGFGLMTGATLLVMAVTHRLQLRSRLHVSTEARGLGLGDVRTVMLGVATFMAIFEIALATILTARFAFGYGEPFGRALWLGVFHSVSAFNNAGFGLYENSLIPFAGDPWVVLPIAIAFICGGLGFPVLIELRRHLRNVNRWSLHTKLTLTMTAVLLVGGTFFVLGSEWRNPATLASMSLPDKVLNAFFTSATTRTAGFNTLDTAAMTDGTWLGATVMMFIGGGSASTAGGIKVTTIALLLFVVLAEIRGERHVVVFDRQVAPRVQRQALTVAFLGLAAVVSAALIIAEITDHALDRVLFEVVSAFGTVGMSTGITAELTSAGHVVIILLMFIGRLGPITFATALALRQRGRLYELPEGRPIIG